MKNAKCRILTVVLCVLLMAVPVRAEDTAAVITSFEIRPSGIAEICGYVSREGEKVAVLMVAGDEVNITPEVVIYIDQIEAGRNGAFLLKFIIPERWANTAYTLAVGGQSVGTTIQRGTLGALPELIHRVDNNSIRVGKDIYDFDRGFTPENIADSLSYGGNEVFYKIGGMWFDLMDAAATSSAYLTEENAVPKEEYLAWEIRVYYAPGEILEGT